MLPLEILLHSNTQGIQGYIKVLSYLDDCTSISSEELDRYSVSLLDFLPVVRLQHDILPRKDSCCLSAGATNPLSGGQIQPQCLRTMCIYFKSKNATLIRCCCLLCKLQLLLFANFIFPIEAPRLRSNV